MSTFSFDDNDVALQRRVNDLLDWGLVMAVIGVLGIGLVSIYSATYPGFMDSSAVRVSDTFIKQIIYASVGIAAAVGLFFVPERWVRDLSYPMYAIGILLLIAVLVPGIGHVVNGQQCWIRIGGFTFQPSEMAKITTLLALARFISEKSTDVRSLRDRLVMLGIIGLPIGLIMLQPDTGSAAVFMAMALGLLLCIYGVLVDNMWWFIIIVGLVAIGAFLFRRNVILTTAAILILVAGGLTVRPVFERLEPYKQNRLITLFEPERNPRGQGYHVLQSMLAVGSGGITGKGFRQGTQTQLRYIPEQWTDFIFCVPTEEFGFVGGLTVIGLLAVIMHRAMQIASTVRTRFASVIAFGFGSILFFHTLVNIGMAIGLFPVMGIPLPFLSAGGTALIVNLAVIGLLLNFFKTRRRRAGRV
jgi:rod shape determining protein RodA